MADHLDPTLEPLFSAKGLLVTVAGGQLLSIILSLAPGVPAWTPASFGLLSLAVQWVILSSLFLLWVLRSRLATLTGTRVGWLSLLIVVLATAGVASVSWELLGLQPQESATRWAFVLRSAGLALAVGLVALLGLQNYWNAKFHAKRARHLELEALHARIRPHFLFNTLNTGAALVHAQPDAAERVLLDLADLFRHALRGPRLIPLAEELDLTRRYLAIEELRLGERLLVEWDVGEPVAQVEIPSLSIQPLVENAVRHGIEPREQPGYLRLRIFETTDDLTIEIRNDMAPNAVHVPGHSIGLQATRERLRALTGGAGSVTTELEDGVFLTRVRIPRSRESGLQSLPDITETAQSSLQAGS